MSDTTPITIIGTGFAGLGMGIKLKEAGFHDFVILEQADEVGGTWRDNQYPGCACDVQSALYSFSFEQNPNWSRTFAEQEEILDYLKYCARKYDLYPHIRFHQQVAGARFDEASQTWTVETANAPAMWDYMAKKGLNPGDAIDRNDPEKPEYQSLRTNILISGMGGLSTPAYPNIPGVERFEGKSFHSQNWDHDYDLKGKRVAVIGTGASAIQFVPEVAKDAAQLDLYQRTPPWIMEKPDRPFSKLERTAFRHVPGALNTLRQSIYWKLEARVVAFALSPRLMKVAELDARRLIRKQIKDPVLRKKVTPDYTIGCKRILMSNNYYPALAQDNVDVITDGIQEVRPHSIIDKTGKEREIDALIYGTGFRATEPLPEGMVFGRGGQDLIHAWRDGAEAYKGTTVTGFPNFFMMVGPNTGLAHTSLVYMIECQIEYILDAITKMRQNGWQSVDVQPEVQREFNEDIQSRLDGSVWQDGGCNSWYIDENGKNTTLWPSFTWHFRHLTSRFDAAQYHCEPAEAPITAAPEPATA
ncbi:4-hydroxyacetophenone monooxygenase [Tamilnaduibacter salinus]|uniref:4-hydroxyacetophenone monooxygenase n=1 Tax=Tamilnaduibacter salinus TaxID=1484056 RepID=A0A2A2I0D4_9GAMM|nr:NAD(P)/FAD-dependent oxidoreductase [Tamilnaduibacter salinus]PAV24766.1 4-hydroxyacetophenone monooxygenase [Tamilnaduibacter salinus]